MKNKQECINNFSKEDRIAIAQGILPGTHEPAFRALKKGEVVDPRFVNRDKNGRKSVPVKLYGMSPEDHRVEVPVSMLKQMRLMRKR